jgi:hypothetical protein
MGYVAFGPFLSVGALTMLFWSNQVYRLIQAYMAFMGFISGRFVRLFV